MRAVWHLKQWRKNKLAAHHDTIRIRIEVKRCGTARKGLEDGDSDVENDQPLRVTTEWKGKISANREKELGPTERHMSMKLEKQHQPHGTRV